MTKVEKITRAYGELRRQTGSPWVSVAALREQSTLTALDFDTLLIEIITSGAFTAIPEENQKTIDAGLSAGVLVGGEVKHYVMF